MRYITGRIFEGAGEVAQDYICLTTELIIISTYPETHLFSFYFTLLVIQYISTLDH